MQRFNVGCRFLAHELIARHECSYKLRAFVLEVRPLQGICFEKIDNLGTLAETKLVTGFYRFRIPVFFVTGRDRFIVVGRCDGVVAWRIVGVSDGFCAMVEAF